MRRKRSIITNWHTLFPSPAVHTARLVWAARPVDKNIGRLEQKLQHELDRRLADIRAIGIFFREAVSALKRRPFSSGGVRMPTQAETRLRVGQAIKRCYSA